MRFTLDQKPNSVQRYRKPGTVELAFITEPFEVETQEGVLRGSPASVDDWEGGYYVAYPDDDSKPYAISPGYVRRNYERTDREHD